MQRATVRRVIRLLVLSLWLPLAILVVSVIRFGLSTAADVGGMLTAGVMIGSMVLFTWIAALPLTLAVTFLYRRVRVLAYVFGAILAPITVFGALIGGLFGPIGIVAYALVFSAPAWIALGITAQIQRGRTNVRPAESA
jgi:hypothetical protein